MNKKEDEKKTIREREEQTTVGCQSSQEADIGLRLTDNWPVQFGSGSGFSFGMVIATLVTIMIFRSGLITIF